MNDQEMIAVPLDDIICQKLDKLCECIQGHAQQPGVQPCDYFPFNISRSIVQTVVCHTATTLFQVPPGMTGVITRISLQERYPGTLYGANFMLIVNDNLTPELPRVDHPIGNGMQDGSGIRICLQEQDMVSIMIQCSWTPVVFVEQPSTFQQTIYPFQAAGYFQPKVVPGVAIPPQQVLEQRVRAAEQTIPQQRIVPPVQQASAAILEQRARY